MKFHGGVSWDEMYDMPVAYKHWYLDRLERELAKGNGGAQDTARGAQTPVRQINLKRLQEALGVKKDA